MKRIREYEFIVIFALFFAVLLFAGCAGQRAVAKQQEVKTGTGEIPDATGKEDKIDEKIIADEKGEYKLVLTPFGYIKRRIKPTYKEAEDYRPEGRVPTPLHPEKVIIRETPSKPEVETTKKQFSVSKEPEKREVPSKKGDVVLNFDDADLYEVIRTFAELLKINYVVDANISGKVTIHTSRGLGQEDLFPVFFLILEVNRLTAVKEDEFYRIVSLKEALRLPISYRIGRESEDIAPGERIIIQIIPLKHISAAEMTKLLTPFISSEGTIISHADSNSLLLVDKGISILKALNLVKVFDIDMFQKVNHRFYPLENVDAEEMIKLLNDIFASYDKTGKLDLKLTAITRLNTLLAISSDPKVFDKVEEFISQLDVPSDEAEPKIYIYAVKNGEADDLAGLLSSVFGESPNKKEEIAKVQDKQTAVTKPAPLPGPFGRKAETKKETQETVSKEVPFGSGTLKGEINITADEIRNNLIIKAIPADYRIIEKILKRIDVLPRQVLIEVTIAEILLDESTQLGIEWTYLKDSGVVSASHLIKGALGASGLQYSIEKTGRFTSALNALASKKKVNILSTPSVLASDNKQARIDISTEIPVASAEYQFTSGEEPVLQTNIQYRNTGVILGVTPHINERGLVSMDITQEVSEQAGDILVAGQSYPSFFKRSVNTTLTVGHAQTIVIGGLISETKDDSVSGVPCLVDLPAFRWVFGAEKTSIRKTELIVLITPCVIASLDDVDAVTEEFKSKAGNAMEEFRGKTR